MWRPTRARAPCSAPGAELHGHGSSRGPCIAPPTRSLAPMLLDASPGPSCVRHNRKLRVARGWPAEHTRTQGSLRDGASPKPWPGVLRPRPSPAPCPMRFSMRGCDPGEAVILASVPVAGRQLGSRALGKPPRQRQRADTGGRGAERLGSRRGRHGGQLALRDPRAPRELLRLGARALHPRGRLWSRLRRRAGSVTLSESYPEERYALLVNVILPECIPFRRPG